MNYLIQKYDKDLLTWKTISIMPEDKDEAVKEMDNKFFTANTEDTSYRILFKGEVIAQRLKDDLKRQ